ncbi:/ / Y_Y_Y domain protein / 263634:269441 Reverse [Candidatus Hepatoplasma crinochetorum]|uniref:/ / Y_Y_Y domain protein / 263634:269441 Reverse n=1 Tax=Candidatus Hepatoplasma crinochetorum TaxID=295596 RepID=A0A0G7ZN92_9MOLU|nr:/ / Y_Y_Y domain protein / 263634:269441 Reverse [Candidatus Hepatoplasma crinochetorum]
MEKKIKLNFNEYKRNEKNSGNLSGYVNKVDYKIDDLGTTIDTSKVNTTNFSLEGGQTQQEVNKANKEAIDANTQAIDDIINNGVPSGNTSTINTTNATTEGGATQQEVNEANKEAIDANTQAIDDIINNGVPSGNTSTINTTNATTEGWATQKEVNEANKKSIDDINDQLDDLSDPITSNVTTVDAIAEGGATQQEVNEANKEAIDNLNTEYNELNDKINDLNSVISNMNDAIISIQESIESLFDCTDCPKTNEPTVNIDNEIIVDGSGNGSSDGSWSGDIIINNFSGQGRILLNPDPNSNTPIDLNDGSNSVEFDNLPPGDYVIYVFDDNNLISEFTFTISESNIPASATIDNVISNSPSIEDGNDGSISFDTNVNGCDGVATASLNPENGTTPITLTTGDNIGLTFSPLPAGDYTIQIYCDDVLINESDAITVPDYVAPSNGFIPLTPEADDGNSKTTGDIDDNYDNYDIIISKNNHPDYVSNGLFIGKEIAIGDLNLSGIIDGSEVDKLTFTSQTNFNTTNTGDYAGIYYLKGINVGLTPLITAGQYHNNDNFTWLDTITNYNMIIQKWSDETRGVKTYTFWEIDTTVGKSYIYAAKNAAETGLNGWTYNNLKIETGIGENSYLEMIYGINFTEITNLVTSSTGSRFTISDYTGYDLLLFNIEQSGNNSSGTWFININDLVQDGATKYSYGNYNDNYFTISGNVITWNAESGIGHLNLVGVKGIKI